MKFLRLRLANYRGIKECEVKFDSIGITLIQGPNEAGKTCLGEAIRILFDNVDNADNKQTKPIKPVHLDEGPEIELDAESGPYIFTYSKRFHKKPATKLTITKPKNENYTGREAHDRAKAILAETLDDQLWKALNILQGENLCQPDLGGQKTLSAALDKVAGGRSADPQEESLFDIVRDEYGNYFAKGGSEKKEFNERRKRQTEVLEEATDIEKQLRDVDADIEKAAILREELKNLIKQEGKLKEEIQKYAASLEEIERLDKALLNSRLDSQRSQNSENTARRAKEDRQGLIAALMRAEEEHNELKQSSELSLPALKQAEEELEKAVEGEKAAEKKKRETEILAQIRRTDFDFYNNKLNFDLLKERLGRIDQARKNAAEAEEVLARNKVDDKALKSIQDAERHLLTANAQLETGAPNVRLRALTEFNLRINDTAITLGKDEIKKFSVADSAHLTIPNGLEIDIKAGSSAEGLSIKAEKAKRDLEDACLAFGVGNPDDASRAFEERRQALDQVKRKGEVEKIDLRDLSYKELGEKLFRLKRNISNYADQRVKEPSLCSDLGTAKSESTTTQDLYKSANTKWETARSSLEAAQRMRSGLSTKHQEEQVRLDILANAINRSRENLEEARKSVPDDLLEAKLAATIQTVKDDEEKVRTAVRALAAKNPDRVKLLSETAKGSLQSTTKLIKTANDELIGVQERLKIHGEEGLHEKLDTTQCRLEQIEIDNRAFFRRASAAKCLFELMRDERDKVRKAYVAPLKEKIEVLGRLVFDESFTVDINDELQIASRTDKGITVPFAYLSAGTREQLSLIFRLACAIIVAKDSGTPLILDDALGYTDPERLKLMGAALAKAAKECQIIIFTCVPDRYIHIGDASIIALR